MSNGVKQVRKRKPILERLYSRTNIPLNKDGTQSKKQCWEWHGVTNNAGYGMMKVDAERGMATVHRISMIEHTKSMNYGDKVEVLHTCGNKSCVNPDHLMIGNIKDRAKLQVKYKNYNTQTFFNKQLMWPVCEHCGGTNYRPHFKRLHSLCEYNAKHKYITDTITGKIDNAN